MKRMTAHLDQVCPKRDRGPPSLSQRSKNKVVAGTGVESTRVGE
jgi:hypothetical protein